MQNLRSSGVRLVVEVPEHDHRTLDGDVGVDCTGGALLPGFIDRHVHLVFDLAGFADPGIPFSLQFFAQSDVGPLQQP